ncbi:MAG: OmpA family protein [Oscillospiraceae bacterium]|nr:OmpA family protein [Oscillospiraceae bacterium]
MKKCPKCQATLEDASMFCVNCGSQLPQQPPAQPMPPSQPVQYQQPLPHQPQYAQPQPQQYPQYPYPPPQHKKSKAGLILGILIPVCLLIAAALVVFLVDPFDLLGSNNDPNGSAGMATADPNVQNTPTPTPPQDTPNGAGNDGLYDFVNTLPSIIAEIIDKYGYQDFILNRLTDGIVDDNVSEIIIAMKADALFEPGSATLTSTGVGVMRVFGEALADIDNNITIAGHTDNVPIITADFSSNYDLSYARALSVEKIFFEQIDSRRITVIAHGEYEPIADNNTAEGRAENRRIELIISVSQPPLDQKVGGTVIAVGSNEYGQRNVSEWADIIAVSAGYTHTVGLKSDGTVVAVEANGQGQCDVLGWRDIIEVSARGNHTVGLKSDGTVVATGQNNHGQCDVSEWRDIVAIAAGLQHTVGLKPDGTVIAIGWNYIGQCNVSEWSDIVAIAADATFTAGLKSDGTVVLTGSFPYPEQVELWRDIVAIDAGVLQLAGLKSDGTVVVTQCPNTNEIDVSEWRNIIAVSCGGRQIVGLKSDGTVIASGFDEHGQLNVTDWRNIIAISMGSSHTVAIVIPNS